LSLAWCPPTSSPLPAVCLPSLDISRCVLKPAEVPPGTSYILLFSACLSKSSWTIAITLHASRVTSDMTVSRRRHNACKPRSARFEVHTYMSMHTSGPDHQPSLATCRSVRSQHCQYSPARTGGRRPTLPPLAAATPAALERLNRCYHGPHLQETGDRMSTAG
jgi:hypothetical protein